MARKRKPTGRIQVPTNTSRCPVCDSTWREPYHHKRELERHGVDPEGKPYTHIVWRHTRCRRCRQQRVDRTTENRNESGREKTS